MKTTMTTTRWALVTGFAALSLMATACSAADGASEPATAVAEASETQAAAVHGDKDGPRDGRGRVDPAQLMKKLDKDGNGTVELAELPEHKQKWLAKADANSDGKLTADELKVAAEARHGRGKGHHGAPDPEAMLKRLDKDGSGALEASELEGRKSKLLERADSNKDGKLTVDELKKHAADREAHRRSKKAQEGSDGPKAE